MNEFNDRIEAQRGILRLINRHAWAKEELFGLSTKAIERWISANRIDPESELVQLIIAASSKLFSSRTRAKSRFHRSIRRRRQNWRDRRSNRSELNREPSDLRLHEGTLAIVEKLHAEGVIGPYAVGGAVGAAFYLEPVATAGCRYLRAVRAGSVDPHANANL